MDTQVQDYIIKLYYFEEWHQGDAKVKINCIDEKKFFTGLELIKMLHGEYHDIVLRALRDSIKQTMELEQKRRSEYRELAKKNIDIGVIPII